MIIFKRLNHFISPDWVPCLNSKKDGILFLHGAQNLVTQIGNVVYLSCIKTFLETYKNWHLNWDFWNYQQNVISKDELIMLLLHQVEIRLTYVSLVTRSDWKMPIL